VPDQSPDALKIEPPRLSPWRNLSVVWLVPLLAIIISVGVAWKSYADRGTLIEITFLDGSGVKPGETTVQFRNVVVGTVETVAFTSDLAKVVISARINKDVAATMPSDAKFWVVRPQINTRGISGLSTVLAGVNIEGAWEPKPGANATRFTGEEAPPMFRPGREGSRITIRASDGNLLPEAAPVFYRGVEVGRLDTPRISKTGDAVLVDAFILAPYDQYITSATRFWDTSGFSVKFGAAGLELNVTSIGALISGGIAFETLFSGGETITKDTVFDLYIDESSARDSVFNPIASNAVTLSVVFDNSVNGLSAGAPVEFRGLRVGQVTAIGAFVTKGPNGQEVHLRTTIEVDPKALGLPGEAGEKETLDFLQEAVSKGLRAKLATVSLFSAALKIDLANLPDAPPAELTFDADKKPVLPTVESDIPDLNATAEGVLKRINALPVEEVMQKAITLMGSIDALVSSEGVRQTPEALAALLEDSRKLINKDETQQIPAKLLALVDDLQSITQQLQDKGAIDRLVSAIDSADKAAANVATASEDFPKLVEDLRALAAKANGLQAEELVTSATRLIDSTNTLIASDDVKAIPPSLKATLDQVKLALQELREGGAVTNTNAALASARSAADAVAAAAQDLPALSDKLSAVVNKVDALVATYGARSDFNAQTLDLLREVKTAARAVAQLAKTIERNPNSLLIGR
jgi:paraquat-inducible protein B